MGYILGFFWSFPVSSSLYICPEKLGMGKCIFPTLWYRITHLYAQHIATKQLGDFEFFMDDGFVRSSRKAEAEVFHYNTPRASCGSPRPMEEWMMKLLLLLLLLCIARSFAPSLVKTEGFQGGLRQGCHVPARWPAVVHSWALLHYMLNSFWGGSA